MHLTKRARRIKHGVTLFHVYGFKDKTAFIDTMFVTSKPYQTSLSLFANYSRKPAPASRSPHGAAFSLVDAHMIGSQTYNWHRVFFSRKKAESYAALIRSGCDVSSMFGGTKRVVNHDTDYPEEPYPGECYYDYADD